MLNRTTRLSRRVGCDTTSLAFGILLTNFPPPRTSDSAVSFTIQATILSASFISAVYSAAVQASFHRHRPPIPRLGDCSCAPLLCIFETPRHGLFLPCGPLLMVCRTRAGSPPALYLVLSLERGDRAFGCATFSGMASAWPPRACGGGIESFSGDLVFFLLRVADRVPFALRGFAAHGGLRGFTTLGPGPRHFYLVWARRRGSFFARHRLLAYKGYGHAVARDCYFAWFGHADVASASQPRSLLSFGPPCRWFGFCVG